MHKFLFLVLFSITASAQIIPQAEPIEPNEPINKKETALQTERPLEKPEKVKPAWLEDLHYGGNIWLGFFGAFYIDASPMAGYEVGEKGTIVGLGGTFIYQGQYKAAGAYAAGARVFVRQPVYKSIFLHAEYEFMNGPAPQFYRTNKTLGSVDTGRRWGSSPLVGAGFYQGRTGQQRGSFISIMYNLGAPSFGYISPQGLGGNESPILLRYGFFF